MHEVAIIGAGELGGACAHILARQNFVASIRLVDDRGSIAIGKALDITQAGPIEAFATRLTGTNDVASAAGASTARQCGPRPEKHGLASAIKDGARPADARQSPDPPHTLAAAISGSCAKRSQLA